MSRLDLPIISLFSGALGLDLGLERAGFRVRVAVENNKYAAQTIRLNRPNLPVIERKIEDVPTKELLKAARQKPGGSFVLTGGPSCQSFSTAGKRGSVADPRGGLFYEFLRIVREARPRFFVMENVRGVLSAAMKHRPLDQRGPGFPPLSPEEELGSALMHILAELRALDYYVIFDLLNTADYGVPQTRERVVFIGSRDGEPISMPEATHTSNPTDGKHAWVTLRQALVGLHDEQPVYSELSDTNKKYLKQGPEGGNWRDMPADIQAEALGGAYVSWGGRGGFFRRLGWDRPAPAITTAPDGKATMMCHPTELRPLSVSECARLQQFPDEWQFDGGITNRYIQIGNAVPVGLGQAIGKAVREAARKGRKQKDESLKGVVACTNGALVRRIAKRPRTMLNPPRMREIKNAEAVTEWFNGRSRYRVEILTYLTKANGHTEEQASFIDLTPEKHEQPVMG